MVKLFFVWQHAKFYHDPTFFHHEIKLFLWQFKLATWLRVYNYVKIKHVRADAAANLVVVSSS